VKRPACLTVLVVSGVLSFSLAAPTAARAQLVGAATLESEYRLRGIGLTNGEPDVRIGLTYDHSSGAYAGGSVIVGDTVRDGVRVLGYIEYAGYAKQTVDGLDWDVGASNSNITLNLPAQLTTRSAENVISTQIYTQKYHADYSEIFGGISMNDVSAHLYFSPDYLGQSLKMLYLDVTATVRPRNRLRLYAHLGALTPLGGSAGPTSQREHFDIATGAVWEFRHGEIELGLSAATPDLEYPPGFRQERSAPVLKVTGFF
jgi:uncharacterized protein (TIGR02001 family)